MDTPAGVTIKILWNYLDYITKKGSGVRHRIAIPCKHRVTFFFFNNLKSTFKNLINLLVLYCSILLMLEVGLIDSPDLIRTLSSFGENIASKSGDQIHQR